MGVSSVRVSGRAGVGGCDWGWEWGWAGCGTFECDARCAEEVAVGC